MKDHIINHSFDKDEVKFCIEFTSGTKAKIGFVSTITSGMVLSVPMKDIDENLLNEYQIKAMNDFVKTSGASKQTEWRNSDRFNAHQAMVAAYSENIYIEEIDSWLGYAGNLHEAKQEQLEKIQVGTYAEYCLREYGYAELKYLRDETDPEVELLKKWGLDIKAWLDQINLALSHLYPFNADKKFDFLSIDGSIKYDGLWLSNGIDPFVAIHDDEHLVSIINVIKSRKMA